MPSAVDVFLLRPDALAPDDRDVLLAWLHPSELERYHRFVFDRHRLEFLATRALVRRALSSIRPIDPPAWRFRITAHGLPFNLANHPPPPVCSLRPADDAAVREVGVDVEPLTRGAEIVPLAPSVFS